MSETNRKLGRTKPFDLRFFGIPEDSAKPGVGGAAKQPDICSLEVQGRLTVIGGKKAVKPLSHKSGPKPGKRRGVPNQRRKQIPRKFFPASDVDKIQWKEFSKPCWSTLECRRAIFLVKQRGLALDKSISPSLYEDFVCRLGPLVRGGGVEGPTLLCHVANGEVPGEEDFGKFGKFLVLGEEFTLPISFYDDCKAAFPKRRFVQRPP